MSRLGWKKYRSAEREDDFFPADPQGPALRPVGNGYLCFKEIRVSFEVPTFGFVT